METAHGNPATNDLPHHVSEDKLREAIARSGYPLQMAVVEQISAKAFSTQRLSKPQLPVVQQEWSYIDPAEGKQRSLDILVRLNLFDYAGADWRPRPVTVLLIECKQSELPYVFFGYRTPHPSPDFPIIAGLSKDHIDVSDDLRTTWELPANQCLSLQLHAFSSSPLARCNTFSKVVRDGSKLRLSGEEPFNEVVSPLTKAVQHYVETSLRGAECRAVLAICVLNGPMVLVEPDKSMVRLPWVRVTRREAQPTNDRERRKTSKEFGLDIVHRDYLDTYWDKALMPFATDFAEMVFKHRGVLEACRASAQNVKENRANLEPHLRPST